MGGRIRCAVTGEVLRQVNKLPPKERRPVLERFGEARAVEVLGQLSVTWLDLETHLDLVDALDGQLGPARVREIFERAYLEGFSRLGMIEGFINAAVRLWSPRPMTLTRALPRAWDSLSTDAGTWAAPAETGERTLRIELQRCSDVMLERSAWTHNFEGVFQGFLSQLKLRGEAALVELDPKRRVATYEMRWSTS